MKIDLPYLNSFEDRHGKMRHYYRRSGRSVAIKYEVGTADFLAEYQRIHSSFEVEATPKGAAGTLDHLVETFYAHHKFTTLRESTPGGCFGHAMVKDRQRRHRGQTGEDRALCLGASPSPPEGCP